MNSCQILTGARARIRVSLGFDYGSAGGRKVIPYGSAGIFNFIGGPLAFG